MNGLSARLFARWYQGPPPVGGSAADTWGFTPRRVSNSAWCYQGPSLHVYWNPRPVA